ncbi:Do family serine endopeptidase [Rhizobium setariae]
MQARKSRVLKAGLSLTVISALLAGTALQPLAAQETTGSQRTQHGPESVADLAESLTGAVVNIAITQSVKPEGDEGFPSPNLPEGGPFEDLFNDYFKGKDKDGAKTARKVSSLGSGFVIDPSGYIVTNNHVIEGATEIEANFANGTKLKAKLVGTDTKTDIAVLKVEPKKPLTFVKLGDSRKMRIGDWVMAIGNPFGLGGSVSVGIVSARNRNINAGPYDNFIQTDAAINRGNSGGPLFNMYGDVIGINTAIISPSGGSIGIGFAVPTEIAANVINQLKEFGEARRGWLGVRIQPVTDEMIADLKMDAPRGALVSGIVKGGPVDNGTVKTGDIILKLDGNDVVEMRDLTRIVAESPIGKPLEAVILRDGKEIKVMVTLGRQTDEAAKPADAKPVQESTEEEVEPDESMPTDPDTTVPEPSVDTLQLSLSVLNAETRKQFNIPDSVEGVLITDVPQTSAAYEKGIRKGDVIVEIAQEFVDTPDAVTSKVGELKQNDRRNAYLMIANNKGELRLVAVPLD